MTDKFQKEVLQHCQIYQVIILVFTRVLELGIHRRVVPVVQYDPNMMERQMKNSLVQ